MANTDSVEVREYTAKLRALEAKKLQLKQHFERIDHRLYVIEPMITQLKEDLANGAEVPKLVIEEEPTLPGLGEGT